MTEKWLETRSEVMLARDAHLLYQEHFGGKPQGIWAAPGRVNVIGDHVDYAGGVCLPFAIAQHTAVAASKRRDSLLRIVSQLPDGTISTYSIDINEVRPGHPNQWAGYVAGTIWAMIAAGLIPTVGFDLAIVSDVPLGAGLSSSAALECATAVAAFDLAGDVELDDAMRLRLATAAMRAENEVVGAATGGLDQRTSMFGQPGKALALDFGTGEMRQVDFDLAAADLTLLIADTNAPHTLNDGHYASRRGIIDAVTAGLGEPGQTLRDIPQAEQRSITWATENAQDPAVVQRRVRHVVSETARTQKAIAALEERNFDSFRALMQESHESLRDDYEVVTPELESVFNAAGKYGARMTGGGFGGSMIVLLPTSEVSAVAHRITQAAAAQEFPQPQLLVAQPGPGARRLQ
ncbi:MAG: galactokinase [Corynebacterium sp.]|nr:galactokinase [Corynebacterium sp.]